MTGVNNRGRVVLIVLAVLSAGCASPPPTNEEAPEEAPAEPEEPEPILQPPVLGAPSDGAGQVGTVGSGPDVDVFLTWEPGRYTGDSDVTYSVQTALEGQAFTGACEAVERTECQATFPVGATVQWRVEAQASDVPGVAQSDTDEFETLRPVLLLHGFKSKGSTWEPLVPILQDAGFYVLDGNTSQPGTQAPSYESGLTDDFHIPRIASDRVQPLVRSMFEAAGLPSSTAFDIVAHSMGGLVARVLVEKPGAPAAWLAFNGSSEQASASRIATDWTQRVGTLVMVGTPNHGAATLSEICRIWSEQCEDMTPRSPFLSAMGSTGREGVHYVSIGSVVPTPVTFRDFDRDGVKHGGDCIVPAESPYLSNPDHFYIIPSVYHTSWCTGPPQQSSSDVVRIVLEELRTQSPPPDIPPVAQGAELPSSMWRVNHQPTAFRVSPTAANLVGETGQQVRLEGGCQNEDEDLDYTQWWFVDPSGDAQLVETDHAQFQADPWTKSRTYALQQAGQLEVRFRCVDTSGVTGTVGWNITIEEPTDDPPVASAYAPASSIATEAGQSVTFQAACSNPEQDLDRAEWWSRSAGGQWSQDKVDHAQLQTDPWEKTEQYSFDQAGTYEVRFTCYDRSAQEDHVIWTVQVQQPPNQPPYASRVSPQQASGSVNVGDTVSFTAQCSNPEQDLDRGEWWTRQQGYQWNVDEVDYVQWQADPWEKTQSYSFNSQGTFEVRFNCFDTSGQTDSVTWTISVQ